MDPNINETEQLHEEIRQLKEQVDQYENLIKEISAPVIPSIVPDTILIPIVGRLYPERFDAIISKILSVSSSQETNTVIIDFSAITKNEIGELEVFEEYINHMNSALTLMGAQTLYVGFTPAVTQALVHSGLQSIKELHTFSTFRTALAYLMDEKGIEFKSTDA